MAMKVEIFQKENVRPFSPTPESLRNYKLSLLDQLAATFYIPAVLYYNSGGPSSRSRHDYDELKESLSKTLSVFYPLAGRHKDRLKVECNDEGADFIQANITNYDLGDLLRHPKLDLLRQLFPCDPYPMTFEATQPLLAVQPNRFMCGGTAVAICIWHGLADAAALVGFLQTWAAVNRREVATTNLNIMDFIADPSTIFPPVKDLGFMDSISSTVAEKRKGNEGKYITKRFVFGKQEIERMRDECNNNSDNRRPTRVEALSAFIWAAVIRATIQVHKNVLNTSYLLTNVVELRKRMNPPFPFGCLGNINQSTTAWWEAKEAGDGVTAHSLIVRVREAIGKLTNDYVRKMHENGGYLKAIGEKLTMDTNDFGVLSISSWCRFPFLEVDFGWGKPIWINPAINMDDVAIFFDTTNGGVEVWMGLPQLVIYHLNKCTEFLKHVSFSQIV